MSCNPTTQGTLMCCPEPVLSGYQIAQVWFSINSPTAPHTGMITDEQYWPAGDLFSQAVPVIDSVMQRALSLLVGVAYRPLPALPALQRTEISFRLIYPNPPSLPTPAVRFVNGNAFVLGPETPFSNYTSFPQPNEARSVWTYGAGFTHQIVVQKKKVFHSPIQEFCVYQYTICPNTAGQPTLLGQTETAIGAEYEATAPAISIVSDRLQSGCSTGVQRFTLVADGKC